MTTRGLGVSPSQEEQQRMMEGANTGKVRYTEPDNKPASWYQMLCCCTMQWPTSRWGSDVIYDEKSPPPDKDDPRLGTACGFYKNWFASWRYYIKIDYCIFLPFYYLFGLCYVLLKFFLLNPPCLLCLQSEVRFELDAAFPGKDWEERAAFACNWFGQGTGSVRPPHFKWPKIPTSFNHSNENMMWMERFNLFNPCLSLPAQCGSAVYCEERVGWLVTINWWHPHFCCGWVIAIENPEKTGWLAKGSFKCWWPLKPMMQWMVFRGIGRHVVAMGNVPIEMGLSIADPKLFGDWPRVRTPGAPKAS